MMFKTLLFTAAITLAFTQNAKADHLQDQSFFSTAQALAEKAQAETIFDRDQQLTVLTQAQYAQLQHVAHEQAQIWGDTILEGDYQADGQTQIDHVDALRIDGEIKGYKITYFEKGWDTSTCSYPANMSGDLSNCLEGRIIESSFVSTDLMSWTRDMNALAVFENK